MVFTGHHFTLDSIHVDHLKARMVYCSSNARDLVLSQWRCACVVWISRQDNTANNKQTLFCIFFRRNINNNHHHPSISISIHINSTHKKITIFVRFERLMNSFSFGGGTHPKTPNGDTHSRLSLGASQSIAQNAPSLQFIILCDGNARRWHFNRQTDITVVSPLNACNFIKHQQFCTYLSPDTTAETFCLKRSLSIHADQIQSNDLATSVDV